MKRAASRLGAVMLVALCAPSCYLVHGPGEAPDGGPDAPPEGSCCLELACDAVEGACESSDECGGEGCAPACEGPSCEGACCGLGELCLDGACVAPGGACTSDDDCADGTCDRVLTRCTPTTATRCYVPRPFEPELVWENTSIHSTSAPVVADLDGDGAADVIALDVPADPTAQGGLHALSGRDGSLLWRRVDQFTGYCSYGTLAAADLDGDGEVEVVALARGIQPHRHVYTGPPPEPAFPCVDPNAPGQPPDCPPFFADRGPPHLHDPVDARHPSRHVHEGLGCGSFLHEPGAVAVVSASGELMRMHPLPIPTFGGRMNGLVLADLEGDGEVEIIAGGAVFGRDGLRWSDPRLSSVDVTVADVDLDGRMELITARHVFEHDGTHKWSRMELADDGHAVVANVLARSGPPQVIAADGQLLVVRDASTGAPLFGPRNYSGGASSGPPTIADFDGDGRPEIGLAADHAFVVLDPAERNRVARWEVASDDRTPGTVGSSAFDFDGDGASDLAYSDECHVRILSGRSGEVLWVRSNPSFTVWEYPVVADVTGDGRANLVVAANQRFDDSTRATECALRREPFENTAPGLRVFRDRRENWEQTRPTWNQHAFVWDSVDAAGRLRGPHRYWDGHNTVRANEWRGEARAVRAADLRVGALRVRGPSCGTGPVTLEARVENRGSAGVAPGVAVELRRESAAIFVAMTRTGLLPGAAEWVPFGPVERAQLGARPHVAIVDPANTHVECDESNNAGAALRVECE